MYTSPEEDFGMGVIEAMAAGCPVVAWNNAGPGTTGMHGVTGYLARVGSIQDFSSGSLMILKDKKNAEKMRIAAIERAKLFSYVVHNNIVEMELMKSLSKIR